MARASYSSAVSLPCASNAPFSLNTYGGPFVSHAVSSWRIHCTRTGRQLVRQERGFEADVVGRRAAVDLRPVHVDDAHALARHVEEPRDAVAQTVRLHVVRVDRQLIVGRIRHRVRRADRGVALERHLVLGLEDARSTRERGVRVAFDFRLFARRRGAADVVEQAGRRRERRRRRRRPFGFERREALIACSSRSQTTAT